MGSADPSTPRLPVSWIILCSGRSRNLRKNRSLEEIEHDQNKGFHSIYFAIKNNIILKVQFPLKFKEEQHIV